MKEAISSSAQFRNNFYNCGFRFPNENPLVTVSINEVVEHIANGFYEAGGYHKPNPSDHRVGAFYSYLSFLSILKVASISPPLTPLEQDKKMDALCTQFKSLCFASLSEVINKKTRKEREKFFPYEH